MTEKNRITLWPANSSGDETDAITVPGGKADHLESNGWTRIRPAPAKEKNNLPKSKTGNESA